MRRLAIVVLVAVASLSAAASRGDGDTAAMSVSMGAGISVRVPRGWHVVRRAVGPYSGSRPVSIQPAVLASFAVSFARRPCPCARPNYRPCGQWCHELSVRDFPEAGALVFVWEFPSFGSSGALGRGYGFRPARFRVGQKDPHFAEALARELRGLHVEAGRACVEGPGSLPSWWSDFRDAGRVFQVEVYLGPAAGKAVRARVNGLLDGLKVVPRRSS
jgi:hypothetical protein